MMDIAILLGPIIGTVIGVLLTHYTDYLRSRKERKLDIFRELMRTRGIPSCEDYLFALNLIYVDFVKNSKVIDAWGKKS